MESWKQMLEATQSKRPSKNEQQKRKEYKFLVTHCSYLIQNFLKHNNLNLNKDEAKMKEPEQR